MEVNQTKSESILSILRMQVLNEAGPPVRPRCLATVPNDLAEILEAFNKQGIEQGTN